MLPLSVLVALLPLGICVPMNHPNLVGRQSTLTVTPYNQLSISAGTAGNGQAEALAKFPLTSDQFATVSADDLDTINTERESAENAETQAFNPAIDAASGDVATALQNGKIKNKILKLTFEVMALQIKQAQGQNVSSDLSTERGKLDNNIKLDQAAAGQASQAVSFNG